MTNFTDSFFYIFFFIVTPTFPDTMLQTDILAIKQSDRTRYDNMIREIKDLKQKNIFLLTEGSFEDYFTKLTSIPNTTKNVTKFCTTDEFDNWYDSNYFHKYAQEFESIIFQLIRQSKSQ